MKSLYGGGTQRGGSLRFFRPLPRRTGTQCPKWAVGSVHFREAVGAVDSGSGCVTLKCSRTGGTHCEVPPDVGAEAATRRAHVKKSL